mgnify:CR=1 FL=1
MAIQWSYSALKIWVCRQLKSLSSRLFYTLCQSSVLLSSAATAPAPVFINFSQHLPATLVKGGMIGLSSVNCGPKDSSASSTSANQYGQWANSSCYIPLDWLMRLAHMRITHLHIRFRYWLLEGKKFGGKKLGQSHTCGTIGETATAA